MSTRGPNEPSDKLDAALDGRPVEADGDLAPLLEAAAALSAALQAIELDPEAADRHLGMILDGGGEATLVPLPTPPPRRAGRWRRRAAAVALAAALVVLPATVASASALPGQALYPVKLAVERLRVTAVSWSNTREASERIKVTHSRLAELDRLVQLNQADRIPPAIVRLDHAYADAHKAVQEAMRDSGGSSQARALQARLAAVKAESAVALLRLQDRLDQGVLPASAAQAIADAIQQAPVTPALVKGTRQPTPTTGAAIVTTLVSPTSESPATTQPPSTTESPTTTEPPTTTESATTTAPPDVSNAPDQSQGGTDDSGQGSSEETATTLP